MACTVERPALRQGSPPVGVLGVNINAPAVCTEQLVRRPAIYASTRRVPPFVVEVTKYIYMYIIVNLQLPKYIHGYYT